MLTGTGGGGGQGLSLMFGSVIKYISSVRGECLKVFTGFTDAGPRKFQFLREKP